MLILFCTFPRCARVYVYFMSIFLSICLPTCRSARLLLWVLCHFTRFARLVWSRFQGSPSLFIQGVYSRCWFKVLIQGVYSRCLFKVFIQGVYSRCFVYCLFLLSARLCAWLPPCLSVCLWWWRVRVWGCMCVFVFEVWVSTCLRAFAYTCACVSICVCAFAFVCVFVCACLRARGDARVHLRARKYWQILRSIFSNICFQYFGNVCTNVGTIYSIIKWKRFKYWTCARRWNSPHYRHRFVLKFVLSSYICCALDVSCGRYRWWLRGTNMCEYVNQLASAERKKYMMTQTRVRRSQVRMAGAARRGTARPRIL